MVGGGGQKRQAEEWKGILIGNNLQASGRNTLDILESVIGLKKKKKKIGSQAFKSIHQAVDE